MTYKLEHINTDLANVVARLKEGTEPNFTLYHYSVNLFRENIKTLIYRSGYNVEEFCRLMASYGVSYKSNNLRTRSEKRKTRLNVVHIVTFARIFGIDAGILISVDLKQYFAELDRLEDEKYR